MVLFCVAIAQNQNQEIKIGTLCVYSYICRFVQVSLQSRYKTIVSPQRSLSCYSFAITPTAFSPLSLTPDDYELLFFFIILSFEDFYRNEIIQYITFWQWLFLTHRNVPEFHPSCVDPWFAHFYYWVEIYIFSQWLLTDLDFDSWHGFSCSNKV